MTPGSPQRLAAGAALLVAVWIGVYWAWEPRSAVSFQRPAESSIDLSESEPQPEEISLDQVLQLVQGSDVGATTPDAQATNPADPLQRQVQIIEHIVKRGETFESLAEFYYRDPALWTVLARENPFTSADRLTPGAVIRVPLGDAIKPEPDKPPLIPRDSEYVVRAGDSLSTISQTVYGTSRHVNAIFRANRHQLSSPNAIRVGQILVIPAIESLQDRPASSSEGQR